ncbi:hypothetical protein Tco_0327740 [Tanacetum coccineum]
MKLEDLGLNTDTHDLFLSSKGFPSVDEPEPQLLLKVSPLDVTLGDKRGTDPPINPYRPGKKAHLLEDKQISSVDVFDEVYFAFGRHWEELHVTWAHLEKKQTRLRTYTNITQDNNKKIYNHTKDVAVTASHVIGDVVTKGLVPHHGVDLWLQVQIFYDHVDYTTQMAIDYAAGGRLRKLRQEEAWKTIEDLAQYEEEEWNDPTFSKKGSPDYIDATLEQELEKVDKTIGIPTEVEPLDHMELDNLGLNTDTQDLFLSSNGFPSVDEPEPQLLPKFSPLDVNLGTHIVRVIFDEKRLGSS